MSTYVQKIRPQFAIPEEQALFDKADGKAYPDGIGKRITAFYQKAEIRPDIRISSTGIRKMRSTQVHSNEPEAAGAVRRLMAHSEKSAQLSYVLASLTKTAAVAHDPVSRNLLATPTTSAEDKQSITSHYGNWSLKSIVIPLVGRWHFDNKEWLCEFMTAVWVKWISRWSSRLTLTCARHHN